VVLWFCFHQTVQKQTLGEVGTLARPSHLMTKFVWNIHAINQQSDNLSSSYNRYPSRNVFQSQCIAS